MSYPINYPTPENANCQEFYKTSDWVKPQGVAMVRFLLIGAGGGGGPHGNGNGGGSGAITSWIGPAIFIPDVLRIVVGRGGGSNVAGTDTNIVYQQKDGTGYTLLTAAGGLAAGNGGTAMSNNYFGAAGIFSSIGGQSGSSTVADSPFPTDTFVQGGAGGSSTTVNAGRSVLAPYGYPTISGGATGTPGGSGGPGFFVVQPLMFGMGGSGGGGNPSGAGGSGGNGGIGCGGGGGGTGVGSVGGRGGDGAVFIWSW